MVESEPGNGQVEAAAERLEERYPGYLAKVRSAAARLGVHTSAGDVDVLLEDLADQARMDVEVPTTSRRREGVYLKKGVKVLTGWYLRYLAEQMTAFGESVARLGRQLAATTDELQREVADLKGRVERLENSQGGK